MTGGEGDHPSVAHQSKALNWWGELVDGGLSLLRVRRDRGPHAEALGGGGHPQGLVWPEGIVVLDPTVKSALGVLQGGWAFLGEELGAEALVEPLDLPRGGG
jgi:hypothetical protein